MRLRLPGLLAEALEDVDPMQPDEQTQLLLDAVIQKALQPWRREQNIDRIILAAVAQLPAEYQKAVTVEAQKRVRAIKKRAPSWKLKPQSESWWPDSDCAIEHHRMCQRIISGLSVPGASPDEDAEAREIAGPALKDLPVGSLREASEGRCGGGFGAAATAHRAARGRSITS